MKAERSWLAFALVYPTLLAWVYFLALPRVDGANPFLQFAYAGGKTFQLLLPIIVFLLVEGRFPRPVRPRFRGLWPALAFSAVVLAGMMALYFLWLKHTPIFRGTSGQVMHKLTQFGLATPSLFLVFGVFVSLPHALLEEYYWRWFVYGRLRNHVSVGTAMLLSSVGFMAHHVIVLAVYMPGHFWSGAVPLSLCIVVGGLFWAWLYEKYGTIYPAWLSHALIDMGIFVIGYDLLRERLCS
jgi:uncharacterized protein